MKIEEVLDEKKYKNLPDFLIKTNHKELVKLIRIYEEKNDENGIRSLLKNSSMENNYNISYELPTKELIESLGILLKELKIKKIKEFAAGSGLFSAIMKKYLGKDVKYISSEPYGNKDLSWYYNLYKNYNGKSPFDVNILDEDFSDYLGEKNIIICWLHSMCEDGVIDMLKTGNVENFIHIGEGIGRSCFSDEFVEEAEKLGYNLIKIPVLSVCQTDYYNKDKYRELIEKKEDKCMCRSEISLFSKSVSSLPIKKLFANRLGLNIQPLTFPEIQQDIDELGKNLNCSIM